MPTVGARGSRTRGSRAAAVRSSAKAAAHGHTPVSAAAATPAGSPGASLSAQVQAATARAPAAEPSLASRVHAATASAYAGGNGRHESHRHGHSQGHSQHAAQSGPRAPRHNREGGGAGATGGTGEDESPNSSTWGGDSRSVSPVAVDVGSVTSRGHGTRAARGGGGTATGGGDMDAYDEHEAAAEHAAAAAVDLEAAAAEAAEASDITSALANAEAGLQQMQHGALAFDGGSARSLLGRSYGHPPGTAASVASGSTDGASFVPHMLPGCHQPAALLPLSQRQAAALAIALAVSATSPTATSTVAPASVTGASLGGAGGCGDSTGAPSVTGPPADSGGAPGGSPGQGGLGSNTAALAAMLGHGVMPPRPDTAGTAPSVTSSATGAPISHSTAAALDQQLRQMQQELSQRHVSTMQQLLRVQKQLAVAHLKLARHVRRPSVTSVASRGLAVYPHGGSFPGVHAPHSGHVSSFRGGAAGAYGGHHGPYPPQYSDAGGYGRPHHGHGHSGAYGGGYGGGGGYTRHASYSGGMHALAGHKPRPYGGRGLVHAAPPSERLEPVSPRGLPPYVAKLNAAAKVLDELKPRLARAMLDDTKAGHPDDDAGAAVASAAQVLGGATCLMKLLIALLPGNHPGAWKQAVALEKMVEEATRASEDARLAVARRNARTGRGGGGAGGAGAGAGSGATASPRRARMEADVRQLRMRLAVARRVMDAMRRFGRALRVPKGCASSLVKQAGDAIVRAEVQIDMMSSVRGRMESDDGRPTRRGGGGGHGDSLSLAASAQATLDRLAITFMESVHEAVGLLARGEVAMCKAAKAIGEGAGEDEVKLVQEEEEDGAANGAGGLAAAQAGTGGGGGVSAGSGGDKVSGRQTVRLGGRRFSIDDIIERSSVGMASAGSGGELGRFRGSLDMVQEADPSRLHNDRSATKLPPAVSPRGTPRRSPPAAQPPSGSSGAGSSPLSSPTSHDEALPPSSPRGRSHHRSHRRRSHRRRSPRDTHSPRDPPVHRGRSFRHPHRSVRQASSSTTEMPYSSSNSNSGVSGEVRAATRTFPSGSDPEGSSAYFSSGDRSTGSRHRSRRKGKGENRFRSVMNKVKALFVVPPDSPGAGGSHHTGRRSSERSHGSRRRRRRDRSHDSRGRRRSRSGSRRHVDDVGRSVRRDLVGYYYKDSPHGSTPRLQLPNLFGNNDRPPTPVSNMKRLREG